MTQLPTKISPCPIIEAIVELKFTSSTPKDAIFGIIYNSLKNDFKRIEKASVSISGKHDIDVLQQNILYKLIGKKYTAQIRPNIISLHISNDYIGWKDFSEKIINFFNKINETNIIEEVNSLSLRYLNFFDTDIYDNINFKVNMLNNDYKSDNLVIRTEILDGKFIKILQIANSVSINNNNEKKDGSLLDIGCMIKKPVKLFENLSSIINEAHELEKQLFFGLLNNDFLKTLNPVYND